MKFVQASESSIGLLEIIAEFLNFCRMFNVYKN